MLNFMNAKEMKYNDERKKITFTWKPKEEEENYIHFTSPLIHNLLLFTESTEQTHTQHLALYTAILWPRAARCLLLIFLSSSSSVLLFLLCLERFWTSGKGGERAEAAAARSRWTDPKRATVRAKEEDVGSHRKNGIDNGTMCTIILLPHLSWGNSDVTFKVKRTMREKYGALNYHTFRISRKCRKNSKVPPFKRHRHNSGW